MMASMGDARLRQCGLKRRKMQPRNRLVRHDRRPGAGCKPRDMAASLGEKATPDQNIVGPAGKIDLKR